jgi:hypothetical protein
MEAAGNIRSRDSWHHSGVVTCLPVAKAFAHVAIDVEYPVRRLDGVHGAFTPNFLSMLLKQTVEPSLDHYQKPFWVISRRNTIQYSTDGR